MNNAVLTYWLAVNGLSLSHLMTSHSNMSGAVCQYFKVSVQQPGASCAGCFAVYHGSCAGRSSTDVPGVYNCCIAKSPRHARDFSNRKASESDTTQGISVVSESEFENLPSLSKDMQALQTNLTRILKKLTK